MKILLTGASGFVGKHLLPALLAADHHVTLLGRRPSGHSLPEILAELPDWGSAVRGESFDACIHLAWIATPGIYLHSPDNGLFADATAHLATSLYRNGLSHFLGLGTCIEYAPGLTQPCREDHTHLDPQSPYASAKHQAHLSIASAATLHQAGYTWARLFYPYGPGEHPNRIPSTFLRTLSARQPLDLKTPGSIKDWIHIRDVASALLHIIQAGPQGPINLGTGTGTSILEFAHLAAEITDASTELVHPSHTPANDPYALHLADNNKLIALGWRPSFNLLANLTQLYSNLSSPVSSLS